MALDKVIHLRVNPIELKQFESTCKELDRNTNDTIRELILAFAENRIKITPTKSQNKNINQVYHKKGSKDK